MNDVGLLGSEQIFNFGFTEKKVVTYLLTENCYQSIDNLACFRAT